MCYSRYKILKKQRKQAWKTEENERLKLLVQIHGKKWKKISSFMPGKNKIVHREKSKTNQVKIYKLSFAELKL